MSWVQRVETVLNVLKGSNIGEIELAEGGFEIILRRRPGTFIAVKAQQNTVAHQPQHQGADHHTVAVKAPLTGVYYAAPSPNAEPFVKVGDHVTIGQTIATIEAMKVFNEIQAEVAGRVVAIQVQNGKVVKKDEILFQIAQT
jgi:acetyl-CoA carboxylase biotin carboxyl carrier protein